MGYVYDWQGAMTNARQRIAELERQLAEAEQAARAEAWIRQVCMLRLEEAEREVSRLRAHIIERDET